MDRPFRRRQRVDTEARVLADKVSKILGQAVVVENKAGAGGTIGVAQAARSPADGYTVVSGTNGTHGVASVLYGSNLGYDPIRDFAPITAVSVAPFVVLVNGDSRWKTIQELMADIKAHPGKFTYASGGNGTLSHIGAQMVLTATGTDMSHIPYRGTGPARVDLLAGRVDVMVDSLTNTVPLMEAGKLRGLAALTPSARSFTPDLPTLEAVGVKGFEVSGWHVLLAPAGTPRAAIDRLNAAFREAMKDPLLSKNLASKGLQPTPTTPEELAAFMKVEVPKWEEAARKSGARVE